MGRLNSFSGKSYLNLVFKNHLASKSIVYNARTNQRCGAKGWETTRQRKCWLFNEFVVYRLDHGDRFPFDGKGIVLAHAFFPSSSGSPIDVHFDADESWIMQGQTEPGKFISTGLFLFAIIENDD